MRQLLLCIWLLGPLQLLAQPDKYYFYSELFGIEEGMDHGVISDVQVDQNDMLWIRTINNIQLFDGFRFIDMDAHVNDAFINGHFNFMEEDGVIFLNGQHVIRFDTKTYFPDRRQICTLPFLPDSGHCHIVYEDANSIFVTHPNDSLYQVDKSLLRITNSYVLPIQPDANLRFCDIRNPASTSTYIGYYGKDGFYYELNLTNGKSRTRTDILSKPASALSLGADSLIVLGRDTLYFYKGNQVSRYQLPEPRQDGFGNYLLLYPNNKLLVALKKDVYEFDLSTASWTAVFNKIGNPNLFDIKIRSMDYDAAGNLYIADFNRGLIKMYPRNEGFGFIGTHDASRKFVKSLSVSEKNNLVLMGTIEDGLMVFDTLGNLKKQFVHPMVRGLKYISYILKLTEDRFLVFADKIYELHADGESSSLIPLSLDLMPRVSYYPSGFEIPGSQRSIINTGYDVLDFTFNGEIRMNLIREDIEHTCLANTLFKGSMLTARTNQIYLTDLSSGRIFQTYKIPGFGYSRSVVPYDSQHVLLGTDLGLYLVEIREDSAIIRKRYYDKLVYAILPGNKEGEFWFSTDFGLFRLDQNEQIRNFSREDGLQDNEFNTNSCYKSASGKLYFGGVNGITAFYPGAVNESDDRLVGFVSNISSNHKTIANYSTFDTIGHFDLSYRDSSIEIELLGKGQRAPESYNYQYMMKGLDPAWVNLGSKTNVNFHLAPGKYQFYYHIGDGFNPDIKPERGFTMIIRPPFYYQWWFVATASLAILGASAYLFVQQKKKQTLRLMYEIQLNEKLQQERMRISRELHDNIGAQMATVKRNINFLVTHLDDLPKSQVERKMQDLENISTQINQELRDTIWAAQNVHISVGDFIKRIKSYVFQVLGVDSPVRVHYIEQCDKEVVLGPFTALNLHRICQEAVNNILKHAHATEIVIGFEGDLKHFKVSIADNGKGFNAEEQREGYGLQNIRHRASQIDAHVRFMENPGGGSKIEIEMDRLIMSDKIEN